MPVIADETWRDDADCRYSDPAGWDADLLPELLWEERTSMAQRACAGCPVIRECAQWVLDYPHRYGTYPTGVVVAGVILPASPNKTAQSERIRRRIAAAHNLPYSPFEYPKTVEEQEQ